MGTNDRQRCSTSWIVESALSILFMATTMGTPAADVAQMHAEGRKVLVWTLDVPQYISQFIQHKLQMSTAAFGTNLFLKRLAGGI